MGEVFEPPFEDLSSLPVGIEYNLVDAKDLEAKGPRSQRPRSYGQRPQCNGQQCFGQGPQCHAWHVLGVEGLLYQKKIKKEKIF